MNRKDGPAWAVKHDVDKCALCVVCARNCPTGALRREEGDEELKLIYRAELCDACGGDPTCQTRCPEEAIQIVAGEGPVADEQLLNQSPVVHCAYCNETFAPDLRLDVISDRRLHKKVQRELCPLCRRTNMVVQFIERHRTRQGTVAEYRAAHDIIRKANIRIKAEKAEKDS